MNLKKVKKRCKELDCSPDTIAKDKDLQSVRIKDCEFVLNQKGKFCWGQK